MTEQQPFELLQRYPHFELRRYPAHVVAEIRVTASFDRAGNAAFRHLFNYISGKNTASQKLAMTAPVIQGTGSQGTAQKLAMTAPVLQSGPLPGKDAPADFVVAFVLPAGLTAEAAPVPANPDVKIRAPWLRRSASPAAARKRPSNGATKGCRRRLPSPG